MFFQYLKRGLTAGLVAGLAFGVFMAFVGNPFVVYTDELAHGGGHAAETGGDGHDADAEAAAGEHHEESDTHEAGETGHEQPAVSMAVTKLVSVATSGFWGLLFGAVFFGGAFYFLEPAIPGTADTKSYLLAAAGFVTVSGAPWLALPPVAPGMDQALPTQTRLYIYGGMMVAGLVACLLSGLTYNRLNAEHGRIVGLVGAAVPLALLPVVAMVTPANPVTGTVPADLVAAFQGFVVFGQLVLWLVLASAHAWLQRRADDDSPDVETGLPDTDSVTA
ncbi:CbtA family protein [Haloarculaceae archaeon H-GB11]|nr:CbtA family protein [Haloarculaceae archaeon H-GB11]